MNKSFDQNHIRTVLAGGSLLGNRQKGLKSDIVSWNQFEPLITPEITLDKRESQRFILLPHGRFISVLAYKTGSQIAALVPFLEGEEVEKENNIIIESVCIAKYPRKVPKVTFQDVIDKMEADDEDNEKDQAVDDVVVMVGCRDGTIREFSLRLLENLDNNKAVDCGTYQIAGPCCRPRRVIRILKKDPIMHITAPVLHHQRQDGDVLIYIAARTKGLDKTGDSHKDKISSLNVAILRVQIPSFDGKAQLSLISKEKDEVQRKLRLDNVRCRVFEDKLGNFLNTAPFRMCSVVGTTKRGQNGMSASMDSVFVVLARPNAINVYYDEPNSSLKFSPLTFPFPTHNPLTAVEVSVNNSDITCGHYHGEITIMNNVLDQVQRYHIAMSKSEHYSGKAKLSSSVREVEDPRKSLITSKVHWHAHPVTSLAYDAVSSPTNPILYSGGEESVLVTWQISQGSDRPMDVLPRLALGGIVHVVCADRIDNSSCNGILVYCEDNSLQLFESHNKGRMWKIQGLAWKANSNPSSHRDVCIEVDPRSKRSIDSRLVITGLPEAPGYMHWYDPIKQRLALSLEVAPFNRVSRTERSDSPLPAPSITNHAFCEGGSVLITIEETPTENLSVGALEKREKGGDYGIVSTIRFWTWNDLFSECNSGSVPYNLVAAMTYPHGPKNRVAALAISKDGTLACTVSNEEKAFRVWQKVDSNNGGNEAGSVPIWTCRYKVTIPSGFSNFTTSRNGVAFSDDGSLLAIAFGNMISLWDSDEARFLASIRHLESPLGSVRSVKFVSPGLLQDLLLIDSDAGVSLKSPFASQENFEGWSWGIPPGVRGVVVSSVELVVSHGCVAVTVCNTTTDQSRLIFLEAASGTPGAYDDLSEVPTVVKRTRGCISSMCALGRAERRSNWSGASLAETLPLNLYALTNSGVLLLFTNKKQSMDAGSGWKDVSQSSGPRLNINRGDSRKRRNHDSGNLMTRESEMATKKMAVQMFGSSDDGKVATSASCDLPSLNRNFVRAFVSRSLARRKTEPVES